SRRRHTRFSRDWSSDVCSSDLIRLINPIIQEHYRVRVPKSTRRFDVGVVRPVFVINGRNGTGDIEKFVTALSSHSTSEERHAGSQINADFKSVSHIRVNICAQ